MVVLKGLEIVPRFEDEVQYFLLIVDRSAPCVKGNNKICLLGLLSGVSAA